MTATKIFENTSGGEGFLDLISSQATDLSVVNAARVSFGKRKDLLEEGDKKLINFLMREKHGSVFEHNFFSFHIKAPIFVAREWFRHRISSFNELSFRYAKPELEFFFPAIEDVRTQVGKPGAYTFNKFDDEGMADFWLRLIKEHCDRAEELYEMALDMGIAREQARIILPVNVYTEFYWTVNARSLMNFISLRNSPHAMKEIRDYAEALEKFFEQEMPITYKSFIDNGRIAV